MNLTQEQLEIDEQYESWIPLKTTVIAYNLVQGKDGKITRNEWFRSIYFGRTTRGLLLIPISKEENHGFSEDKNCAQFFAYPQYSKNPIQYRALKNGE